MSEKPRIVILIPAFNEQEKITKALNLVSGKMTHELKDFEIILAAVNDGSTDKTKQILKARRDVESIHLPENMGKAFAIMHGIKEFSKLKPSAIMIMDADTWEIKGQVVKKMLKEALKPKVPTVVQAVAQENNQGSTIMRDYSGAKCFNKQLVEKLASLNLHHFERGRAHNAPGFGLEEFLLHYISMLPEKAVVNLTPRDGYFRTSSPWRHSRENYALQRAEVTKTREKMYRILKRRARK